MKKIVIINWQFHKYYILVEGWDSVVSIAALGQFGV